MELQCILGFWSSQVLYNELGANARGNVFNVFNVFAELTLYSISSRSGEQGDQPKDKSQKDGHQSPS